VRDSDFLHVRVRDYRVVYEVRDDVLLVLLVLLVLVVRVGYRREICRGV